MYTRMNTYFLMNLVYPFHLKGYWYSDNRPLFLFPQLGNADQRNIFFRKIIIKFYQIRTRSFDVPLNRYIQLLASYLHKLVSESSSIRLVNYVCIYIYICIYACVYQYLVITNASLHPIHKMSLKLAKQLPQRCKIDVTDVCCCFCIGIMSIRNIFHQLLGKHTPNLRTNICTYVCMYVLSAAGPFVRERKQKGWVAKE